MKLSSTHSAYPGTGKSGPAHAELPRAGAGEPGLGLAGADVPGDSGPTFLPSPCCLPVPGPSGLWRCPSQPTDFELFPPWLWACRRHPGALTRALWLCPGLLPSGLPRFPAPALAHSSALGASLSRVLEAPGGRTPMVLCPLSHCSAPFLIISSDISAPSHPLCREGPRQCGLAYSRCSVLACPIQLVLPVCCMQ